MGLEGPAIPVDLVCASSHASIHQAVRALGSGEVDMALAGGVNAALSTPITEFMTDLGMLSTSAQSKPFDADANGFVRGEGCGILVLKRLQDFEAQGDRIWGVILGSAVNQNGASAGLTVPNGSAQQRVMQNAVEVAGVDPRDVGYYEAHGGASQLGDPIELHAAAEIYGTERDENHPLLVGSVKANLGHTERAAGVASVIKVALSMKNDVIPKQLNFDEPNPHVDWDRLPFEVPLENTTWNGSSEQAPLAAISGFGMSGANAHIVMSAYGGTRGVKRSNNGVATPVGNEHRVGNPLPDSLSELDDQFIQPKDGKTRLLPLSAKSEPALRDLTHGYLDWIGGQNPNGDTVDEDLLADLAWTSSSGRSHMGHRAAVIFNGTRNLRDGLAAIAAIDADPDKVAPDASRRVALLYAGGLDRWADSIGTFYEEEPVIRAVMDKCNELHEAQTGSALWNGLFRSDNAQLNRNDADWVNAMTYAIECAMTTLWESVGVIPRVVSGRGIGEIAAAQAAGAFGLEDGFKFALRYSQLCDAYAISNESTDADNIWDGLAISEPSISIVSSVMGQRADSDDLSSAEYWRRQAKSPMTFDQIADSLQHLGVDLIIGIGLKSDTASVISSLHRDAGENGREISEPPTIVTCPDTQIAGNGFTTSVARLRIGSRQLLFRLFHRRNSPTNWPADVSVPEEKTLGLKVASQNCIHWPRSR